MRRLERGGGGEGHVSSDEEDAADDADATDARKRARQGVGCGLHSKNEWNIMNENLKPFPAFKNQADQ